MSKLTSFLTMLTKHLFIYSLVLILVLGAPPKNSNLTEDIQKHRCVFPPANLTIPPKCSEFSLSSSVSKDLRDKDNVEFYLCTALLDSIKRLCSLVTRNSSFQVRVAKQLNESLPTIMSSNPNEKFCEEMNLLDADTTMDQAKFMYSKLKSSHCVSICVGFDDDEMQQRAPLCKSIQFAHQQILGASDLQKSLNDNAHKQTDDEDDSNRGFNLPVQNESPKLHAGTQIQASLTGAQSQSAHIDLPDQAGQQSLANNEALGGSSNKRISSEPSGQASDIARGANSPAIEAPQLPAAAGRPIPPKSTGENGALLPLDKESQRPSVDSPEGRSSAKSKIPSSVTENLRKPSQQNTVEAAAVAPSKVAENGNDGNAAEQDGLPLTEDHEDKGEGFQEKDVADNVEAQKSPSENDANDESIADDDEGTDEDTMLHKQVESQREAIGGKSSGNFKAPNLSPFSKEKPIPVVSGAYGNFVEAEDSHFFAYFMSISALCVLGYLVYHNKRKIIAMAVEGKKSRSTGRRRPNSASYHKLDSNLEEAMSSNLTSTNSYVIY